MATRRTSPEERRAILSRLSAGAPATQLAAEAGVTVATIRRWVREAARDEGRPDERNAADIPLADRFARVTVPHELLDGHKRKTFGLPEDETSPGPYIAELNLTHPGGLAGAAAAFEELFARVFAGKNDDHVAPRHDRISRTYYRLWCSVLDWKELLRADDTGSEERRERSIYKLWPDFPIKPNTDRSVATIKADAASRAFDSVGNHIVWAVLDSGIDQRHVHFDRHRTLTAPEVNDLHRCFVEQISDEDGLRRPLPDPDAPRLAESDAAPVAREARAELLQRHRDAALRDEFGHGTHVAGILAGEAPATQDDAAPEIEVFERGFEGHRGNRDQFGRRTVGRGNLRGVAPRCRLVSLKVLDERGGGHSSNVIRALEYIREQVNDNPKLLRIHGVNLSVGYEFDAEMFACGQSPICAEVDRLVHAGVVVVTAAGNTGYGTVAASERASKTGLSNTINDPGNAAQAITVGSTHRDSPHTFGVSYFSSKGPTGDGRLKPDLIAPGERITSCAAGLDQQKLQKQARASSDPTGKLRAYVDKSGTSMAAPHVSGAIAAFLSIRREFIGRPLDVKRIFLESATSLGRERYFEGHGLLDLMRAIQSV